MGRRKSLSEAEVELNAYKNALPDRPIGQEKMAGEVLDQRPDDITPPAGTRSAEISPKTVEPGEGAATTGIEPPQAAEPGEPTAPGDTSAPATIPQQPPAMPVSPESPRDLEPRPMDVYYITREHSWRVKKAPGVGSLYTVPIEGVPEGTSDRIGRMNIVLTVKPQGKILKTIKARYAGEATPVPVPDSHQGIPSPAGEPLSADQQPPAVPASPESAPASPDAAAPSSEPQPARPAAPTHPERKPIPEETRSIQELKEEAQALYDKTLAETRAFLRKEDKKPLLEKLERYIKDVEQSSAMLVKLPALSSVAYGEYTTDGRMHDREGSTIGGYKENLQRLPPRDDPSYTEKLAHLKQQFEERLSEIGAKAHQRDERISETLYKNTYGPFINHEELRQEHWSDLASALNANERSAERDGNTDLKEAYRQERFNIAKLERLQKRVRALEAIEAVETDVAARMRGGDRRDGPAMLPYRFQYYRLLRIANLYDIDAMSLNAAEKLTQRRMETFFHTVERPQPGAATPPAAAREPGAPAGRSGEAGADGRDYKTPSAAKIREFQEYKDLAKRFEQYSPNRDRDIQQLRKDLAENLPKISAQKKGRWHPKGPSGRYWLAAELFLQEWSEQEADRLDDRADRLLAQYDERLEQEQQKAHREALRKREMYGFIAQNINDLTDQQTMLEEAINAGFWAEAGSDEHLDAEAAILALREKGYLDKQGNWTKKFLSPQEPPSSTAKPPARRAGPSTPEEDASPLPPDLEGSLVSGTTKAAIDDNDDLVPAGDPLGSIPTIPEPPEGAQPQAPETPTPEALRQHEAYQILEAAFIEDYFNNHDYVSAVRRDMNAFLQSSDAQEHLKGEAYRQFFTDNDIALEEPPAPDYLGSIPTTPEKPAPASEPAPGAAAPEPSAPAPAPRASSTGPEPTPAAPTPEAYVEPAPLALRHHPEYVKLTDELITLTETGTEKEQAEAIKSFLRNLAQSLNETYPADDSASAEEKNGLAAQARFHEDLWQQEYSRELTNLHKKLSDAGAADDYSPETQERMTEDFVKSRYDRVLALEPYQDELDEDALKPTNFDPGISAEDLEADGDYTTERDGLVAFAGRYDDPDEQMDQVHARLRTMVESLRASGNLQSGDPVLRRSALRQAQFHENFRAGLVENQFQILRAKAGDNYSEDTMMRMASDIVEKQIGRIRI